MKHKHRTTNSDTRRLPTSLRYPVEIKRQKHFSQSNNRVKTTADRFQSLKTVITLEVKLLRTVDRRERRPKASLSRQISRLLAILWRIITVFVACKGQSSKTMLSTPSNWSSGWALRALTTRPHEGDRLTLFVLPWSFTPLWVVVASGWSRE